MKITITALLILLLVTIVLNQFTISTNKNTIERQFELIERQDSLLNIYLPETIWSGNISTKITMHNYPKFHHWNEEMDTAWMELNDSIFPIPSAKPDSILPLGKRMYFLE